MRKILLKMHTGYAGMDSYEAYLVPDGVTDEELDEWAYLKAVEHAEAYGIYPPSEDDEDDEEAEYSGENIDGYWRLFEDKDAGKVIYGYHNEVSWNKY